MVDHATSLCDVMGIQNEGTSSLGSVPEQTKHAHLGRGVEIVFEICKKKITVLSFKPRKAEKNIFKNRSVKLLAGRGREIRIYVKEVSLGHLISSNRQHICETIPEISALLFSDWGQVLTTAAVVSNPRELSKSRQTVIKLVNTEKFPLLDGSLLSTKFGASRA